METSYFGNPSPYTLQKRSVFPRVVAEVAYTASHMSHFISTARITKQQSLGKEPFKREKRNPLLI